MLHVSGLEPHYDAIIVGARCAGAATAMLLARAGLRVLAVDRQVYGSDTLSTHALMRPAVMQLSRWDLLEPLTCSGTPLIGSTTFHYGPREVIVDFRPEPGSPGLIAPRRSLLDRVLVDAARDAGATILHETSVRELTSDQSGRVTGIVLEDAAHGTRSFRAEHVIGADGIGSLVARSVKAPVLASGNAPVAHIFGYAHQPQQLSGYHWYFGEQVSGGVIPTNDGLACFVVSVPTSRFDTEFRSDLAANWGARAQCAVDRPRGPCHFHPDRSPQSVPRCGGAVARGIRSGLDTCRRCRFLPRPARHPMGFQMPYVMPKELRRRYFRAGRRRSKNSNESATASRCRFSRQPTRSANSTGRSTNCPTAINDLAKL